MVASHFSLASSEQPYLHYQTNGIHLQRKDLPLPRLYRGLRPAIFNPLACSSLVDRAPQHCLPSHTNFRQTVVNRAVGLFLVPTHILPTLPSSRRSLWAECEMEGSKGGGQPPLLLPKSLFTLFRPPSTFRGNLRIPLDTFAREIVPGS